MHRSVRLFLCLLSVILAVWLLRGPIYRTVVHYRVVGERAPVVMLKPSEVKVLDLDAAIEAALDTTVTRLHFSTGQVTSDPRKLVHGSPANCIGYAGLFAALLSGHLAQVGLADRYEVEHCIGKLFIGSWDLHSAFDSPFWKDHDIVQITDKETGTEYVMDPTLYDAIGIGPVSGKNN